MPRLSIPSCLCLALVAMAVVSSTASRTLNQESTLQRCLSAFQAAGGESTLRSNLGGCSSAADLSNGNCCAAVSAHVLVACLLVASACRDFAEEGVHRFSAVTADAKHQLQLLMHACLWQRHASAMHIQQWSA